MLKELQQMNKVASLFEKEGNPMAGKIITEAMKKIARLYICPECGEDEEECMCSSDVGAYYCEDCGKTRFECKCDEDPIEDPISAYNKGRMGADDGLDFIDPLDHDTLRTNKRRHPCPTCKKPNKLTEKDVQLGYQCNDCAGVFQP